MKPTIRDIQRMTNLSLSTISKYLNGGNVLDENKEKIEEAVCTLNYKVNQFGRSLKTNRSNTIGVLIPALYSLFTVSIVMIIEDILRRNGYGIIICDSRNSTETEIDALEFLVSKRVDGIITVPCDNTGKHLQRAKDEGIPIILLDQRTSLFQADAVVINNQDASKKAVAELVAHGHQRIGMICAGASYYTMRERLAGFRDALYEHALAVDDDLVSIVDMDVDGGYKGMKRLLALQSPPTAVVCANSEITLGVVKALYDANIQIGAELSVIGFDYADYVEIVRPKLTYIRQPIEDIAGEASALMLERLGGQSSPDKINIVMLSTTLEKGDSVGQIRDEQESE